VQAKFSASRLVCTKVPSQRTGRTSSINSRPKRWQLVNTAAPAAAAEGRSRAIGRVKHAPMTGDDVPERVAEVMRLQLVRQQQFPSAR